MRWFYLAALIACTVALWLLWVGRGRPERRLSERWQPPANTGWGNDDPGPPGGV